MDFGEVACPSTQSARKAMNMLGALKPMEARNSGCGFDEKHIFSRQGSDVMNREFFIALPLRIRSQRVPALPAYDSYPRYFSTLYSSFQTSFPQLAVSYMHLTSPQLFFSHLRPTSAPINACLML